MQPNDDIAPSPSSYRQKKKRNEQKKKYTNNICVRESNARANGNNKTVKIPNGNEERKVAKEKWNRNNKKNEKKKN